MIWGTTIFGNIHIIVCLKTEMPQCLHVYVVFALLFIVFSFICWKSWKGLQSNPVQSMQSVCHLLHLFHAIFLSLFIGSVFPFVSATCKWTHIFQLTLSHWKPVPRILICQMKTGTWTGATRYFCWRLSSQELSTVWLWQTVTKHLILFHQHASARCHERIFRRISWKVHLKMVFQ